MNFRIVAATLLGLIVGPSAVQGQPGNDETTRFIILDGYVKAIDWSGNHLIVLFHSNDGYSGADWNLEGPSPNYLRSIGWPNDAVKVGDRIDAVVDPNASEAASGQLLRFLLADYRTLETSPYGFSLMYPTGSIKQTIAVVADDPLATAYANTLTCTASESRPSDANESCRVWINADHTIRILRKRTFNGLNPDGTFNLATDTGVWWLEQQLGKLVLCSLIDNAPMPHCDKAVMRHNIGDSWTVTVHGATADWTEVWALEPGRRK